MTDGTFAAAPERCDSATGTMRWAGSRFTGADAVTVERTVTASSGDRG